MAYDITVMPQNVEYGATGVMEVLQNARTLFMTRAGTVPLDREFGIDLSLIDDPMPAARAKLEIEMIQKLQRYEPRARISQFNNDLQANDGRIYMTILLQVNQGEGWA